MADLFNICNLCAAIMVNFVSGLEDYRAVWYSFCDLVDGNKGDRHLIGKVLVE